MPDIYFPNLGIALNNVNRVAISIFGFDIYWYAIFIILGILAGYGTALMEAKRTGQRQDDYNDLLVAGTISAVIGLRLFFVAFNWDLYRHDPIRIITGFRDGGLAIFGGIIASIIVVYLFSKKRGLNFWTILDTCAPSFAIGQVIGRWGNFFNLEAFGGYTDNLFAMRLLRDQIRIYVPPELLTDALYIQVHPTFLYEAMWNLAVFILLTLYRPRKKFDGEVFWLYLLGYGLGRFFIEGLRVDQLLMGELPVSQLMAAIIFTVAVVALVFRRTRRV